MKLLRLAAMLPAVVLFTATASAKVTLPSLIGNGMVLQRDVPLKIWGKAAPDEAVTVTFKGKQYTATTGTSGKWQVVIPEQKAGGPFTLQVNDITLSDILIGDVWLCSGQSNMELPVSRVIRAYRKELETASNRNIRQFKVAMKYSFTAPEQNAEGEWKSVDPVSILSFSAVGYFFASELYSNTKVPVGIINASVGGSPAEAWIDEASVKPFIRQYNELQEYKDTAKISAVKAANLYIYNHWQQLANANDCGLKEPVKWSSEEVNASAWSSITLPGTIVAKPAALPNGSYWLRKEVDIPAVMVNARCEIELGCIMDCDSVYINGKLTGTTGYMYPPRIYSIPEGTLKEGKNVIAIRLMSYNGMPGFVPDKPYEVRTADKTSKVDLKGEWKLRKGATSDPRPSTIFLQYKPTGLYNAMIAPLTPYAIKGVVWYQGESNTAIPTEYEPLIRSLISLWRKEFSSPDLPFMIVQLPDFMEKQATPRESKWAEVREAQANLLSIANTAIATTYDTGEWNDIHPLNKKDVGKRLSDAARFMVYKDKKAPKPAPRCTAATLAGGKVILSFDNLSGGWMKADELKGFTIAGSDGHFVWAKASLEKGKVTVWAEGVINPVEVRYAWADNPSGSNLRSKDGVLAIPFRMKITNAIIQQN